MEHPKIIQVAVGILQQEGRVLMCQRPAHKKYALQWEFPGGKVESGESLQEALSRELREELRIEARPGRILRCDINVYPESGRFEVHYFLVPEFTGKIQNREFADIRWIAPADFDAYNILAGNAAICEDLQNGAANPNGEVQRNE